MTKVTEREKKEMISVVYNELKNREINPSGTFDKGGRFYLDESDLISVRAPSRSYPYSQMTAGRTRKYVKAIFEKYNCETVEQLRRRV